jgi:5'-3' exonuclease
MQVHLVDGTFELFRAYFGSPAAETPAGTEIGAVRGLMRSLLGLLSEPGVSHVGVAFDHTVESFRNDLYAGYKTGEGLEPELLAQFGPAEDATRALGLTVWSMVEFEADDALASAAARFRNDERVSQVVICSPDKDLAQCVDGHAVICRDRIRRRNRDEDGVREKFGVGPHSIPDWLALVGDSADGFPGIPRWGAKSAAKVLAVYEKIERIPADPGDWNVDVRGAATLAANLAAQIDDALLFRRLATLRLDVPLTESLDDLEWKGPDDAELEKFAASIGDPRIAIRARQVAERAGRGA